MAATESYLKGKRILAVDDEEDILETIEDLLDEVSVDRALDYETALRKIRREHYAASGPAVGRTPQTSYETSQC